MPSKIGGGGKQMPLLCGPCWWPWWGVEAIHAASPDAACPWLHRKPLDVAIEQLLTPYCLGGRQGDSKQNNNESCTHCGTIPHASPDGGGLGLSYKPLNTAIGWALLAPIGQSAIAMLLFGFKFEVRWWFCSEVATTYQSDGKDLADGVEYIYWGAKLVS